MKKKPENRIDQSNWALVTNGSDWQALYRDGKLVHQGHDFSTEQVFELLGLTLDYIHPDPTSPTPHPDDLKDVIPFDSEAAEKRRKEAERKQHIERIELEIKQRQDKLAKLRNA
jgi:hypothetical protein